MLDEGGHQFSALVRAFVVNDLVESLEPLGNFRLVVGFGLHWKLDECIQRLVQRHGNLKNLPGRQLAPQSRGSGPRLKNRFCTDVSH